MMHVRVLFAVAACLAAAGTSVHADSRSPDAASAAKQAAAHQNAFAFTLLRVVNKSADNGNTFISPVSIDQAISMLAAGASGDTRGEIDGALHTGDAGPDALAQAEALRDRLLAQTEGANSSAELTVANALWADRRYPLKPEYVSECAARLGAQATTLDFKNPSAADTINHWVATKTRGKINSIVDARSVEDLAAILTNAVYFHGTWDTPFDKQDTQNALFHTASGAAKTIPMMTRTDTLSATQTDALQAVALPYGKSGLSLVVVLPRSGHSLEALAGSLTPETWDHLASSLQHRLVELYLPRFHVDYSTDLSDSLQSLGIRSAFTRQADFSRMSNKPLYVSEVLHKTTLDVDEKGTVATAVTAILMPGAMAMEQRPPQPTVIRVNHPFLCAIRDDATGALLFVGCVRDPEPVH